MMQWLKRLAENARSFVTKHTKLTILIVLALIAFFTFISIGGAPFLERPVLLQELSSVG